MWIVSIVADGRVVVERKVPRGTFRIGRDPASDLVLDDPLASWSHVVLSNDGGQLELRDERSLNGTQVDEEPVSAPVLLEGRETVRIGSTLLRVRKAGADPETRWLLVDQATGIRVPIDRDVFRLGGSDDDDLCVPGLPPHAVVLRRAQGEIWQDGAAAPASSVVVGERRFRVEASAVTRTPTEVASADGAHPYVVTARRNGPHGPEASIEARSGPKFSVDSGNRAVLLYLLAKRWSEDDGKALEERGWIDEHDVQRGIWGRDGDQNKLDVLLYRLRRELDRAGLDPWMVEKRHRQLLVRVLAASVRD